MREFGDWFNSFKPGIQKDSLVGESRSETYTQCEGFDEPCSSKLATRNRQKTSYCDDERNYATLCENCQQQSDDYWTQEWHDYWSDRL